jgi:hypothetical protein
VEQLYHLEQHVDVLHGSGSGDTVVRKENRTEQNRTEQNRTERSRGGDSALVEGRGRDGMGWREGTHSISG